MSVTSLMRTESPSMITPALSRVAVISWLTKRTVMLAMPFRADVGLEHVGLVDADEALVDLLAAGLALADRAAEAVEDVGLQQVAEDLAIAFRKGGHDHLVGLARPAKKMLGIEAAVELQDIHEACGERGVSACKRLDARLDLGHRNRGSLLAGLVVAVAPRESDNLVGYGRASGVLLHARLAAALLDARLLVAGAPAEHASKLDDRHHGDNQRQERQKIDFAIHLASFPSSALTEAVWLGM